MRKEVFYYTRDKADAVVIAKPHKDGLVFKKTDISQWGNLMKDAGVFKSTSQAIKNGFNGDIPHGYHYYTVGKLKHSIEISNMKGICSDLLDCELCTNCECDWCSNKDYKKTDK